MAAFPGSPRLLKDVLGGVESANPPTSAILSQHDWETILPRWEV